MARVSPGRARSRSVKATVVSFCLALSYFALRTATTGDRVQRDEVYVVDDVLNVVEFGHLTEPAHYSVGNGYAVVAGVLLELGGYEYSRLELLSPLLGALFVGVLTLAGVCFVWQADVRTGPWVAIGFPAALFTFAGFTIRVAESSHKKLTYTLVFVSFLLAYTLHRTAATDRRWRLLFVGFASGVALFNYVWAIVYGMAASAGQFLLGLPRRRVLVAGGIPLVVAYVIPVHLPTGDLNIHYTRNVFYLLRGVEMGSGRALGGGGIAAWPPLTVAGVSVSSWFVYASGVFVVGVVAGVGWLHALYRLRHDAPPLARFYVGVGAWFGALAVTMLVVGDVTTLRRIIVLPGGLGVIYALDALGTTSRLTADRRRVLLTAVVVVLLLGSALATPRGILDGGGAPYDYYADEHEIRKFEWWGAHAPVEGCLRTHQFVDLTLSRLVWGLDRPGGVQGVPFDPGESVVYSSGREAVLSCTES